MDLKTYLTTDPDGLGFAPLIAAGDDGAIAALINTAGANVIKSRIISARGILSDYSGGPAAAAAVLDKLVAAAPAIPALRWAVDFLKSDGLDIGHAATHSMLDQLAQAGVLTATECANLKALGFAACSWGEAAGFGNVTTQQIAEARG